MADIDINDLTQARFMGLMCPASSPQSKLLVNDLVDILIKTEFLASFFSSTYFGFL